MSSNPAPPKATLSVAILAHNEADRIGGSLAALDAAGLGKTDVVHVMVNGSTDATADVVRRVAAHDPRIRLHELAFGDKSHAWNTYVYQKAGPADVHIFLDGDVRPALGAFNALGRALDQTPQSLASSALPSGGRRSKAWAEKILINHGLPGNLYALRAATLDRLKAARFFLPVGFVGDDTLLRWILLRDLDPFAKPNKSNIQPSPDAFFEYESFPVVGYAGLRALYKRHRRYSRRDMETILVTDLLARDGLGALPRYASELYSEARLTTTLRAGLIPRQIFALATYLDARRSAGRIPPSDPWSALFSPTAAPSIP